MKSNQLSKYMTKCQQRKLSSLLKLTFLSCAINAAFSPFTFANELSVGDKITAAINELSSKSSVIKEHIGQTENVNTLRVEGGLENFTNPPQTGENREYLIDNFYLQNQGNIQYLGLQNKFLILENEGKIEDFGSASYEHSYIYNAKNGRIKASLSEGDGVFFLDTGENFYLKNEGRIEGNIGADTARVLEIENSGEIGNIRFGYNGAGRENLYPGESAKIINTGILGNVDLRSDKIDVENHAQMGEVNINTLAGKFINNGNAGNIAIKPVTAETDKITGEPDVSDTSLEQFLDYLKDKDPEKGIKDFFDKYGELELHLENGSAKNITIDRQEPDRSELYPNHFVPPKAPPTIVYINEKTQIEKVETNGENDTLVLLGVNNNNKLDANKFVGFSNLELRGGDWALTNQIFRFPNQVINNTGRLHLNGHDGTIDSKTIINKPNSLILVESDYNLSGNVINKGEIHFVTNPDIPGDTAPHKLTLTKDYRGEDGLLTMRIAVEKTPLEHDEMIIAGAATGTTQIQLTNPNSTLKKRMKDKARLIQTASSEDKAFSLAKNRYGIYKYFLSPVTENNQTDWILEQRYSSVIGNILAALSTSQQLFTQTYYDRIGAAQNEHGVWVRAMAGRVEGLVSGEDADIDTQSHLSRLQLGYDIGKFNVGESKIAYGAYLNLGKGSTKTHFVGEVETIKSQLKGYGLGLYASWENGDWYLDSWLQYNRFSNTLNIEDESIKYRIKGLQGSLELGYDKAIEFGQHTFRLQPQAQLIYSHISQSAIPDFEGLSIANRNNLMARLGLRLSLAPANPKLRPFIEFNWLHNFKDHALNVDDETFTLQGVRNIKEIKVGFDKVQMGENFSLWGHAASRFGSHDYKDLSINLGMSYRF